MQHLPAFVIRVAVLIALYAMAAQPMLASAIITLPAQTSAATILCGQSGTGGDAPAHEAASCALSCCLMTDAASTPPSPVAVHTPPRGMDAVSWPKGETYFSPRQAVACCFATGPPLILNHIAI